MKRCFPLHPFFKIFLATLFVILLYFKLDFAATIILLLFFYSFFYKYKLTDKVLEIPFFFNIGYKLDLREILAVSSFKSFSTVYWSVYGKKPWTIPLGNVIIFVARPWLGGGIIIFPADSNGFLIAIKNLIKKKAKKKR